LDQSVIDDNPWEGYNNPNSLPSNLLDSDNKTDTHSKPSENPLANPILDEDNER